MKESKLEIRFANVLAMSGSDLPEPVRELRFAKPRLWRFDFAWPDRLVAVELEGGVFRPGRSRGSGRHTRSKGFHEDCDKYNTAASLGWSVLRFDSRHLSRSPVQCVDLLRATLVTKGFSK